MVKRFCDRCGREIPGKRRVLVRMEAVGYYGSDLIADGLGGIRGGDEKELCPKCALITRKVIINDLT